MLSSALLSFLLAILAFGLGVIGQWKPLSSKTPEDRRLGWTAFILLAATFSVQIYQYHVNTKEERSLNAFYEHKEEEIDEASGAASLDSKLFIVDDDGSELHEYRYNTSNQEKLISGYATYRIIASPRVKANVEPRVVNYIDDLETAASYNNKLYLTTSYSPSSKTGERKSGRELIIEVIPPTSKDEPFAYVSRAARITDSINQALKQTVNRLEGGATLDFQSGDMNIEGLAIDKRGNFYFGFRNPLLKRKNRLYTIVLQTTAEQIFSYSPKFTVIALRLKPSGRDDNNSSQDYGIVSLEYDEKSDELLILGNHPHQNKPLSPRLWTWRPNEGQIQEATLVKDWYLEIPEKFRKNEPPAKPEAIVVPVGSEYGFVFIDSPGNGGIWKFHRKNLGLKP